MLVRLGAAALRLQRHHGSAVPRMGGGFDGKGGGGGGLGAVGPGLDPTLLRQVLAALVGGGGSVGGDGAGKGGGSVGGWNGGKSKGKGKGVPFKEGDWHCESVGPSGRCGFHNFASRTACYKCGEQWTQRQLAGNGVGVGNGGGKNGVARGPMGAFGNKPLLSWGAGGGASTGCGKGEKKPVGGTGGNEGTKKNQSILRASDGFTTMLRGGKPREATVGDVDDECSEDDLSSAGKDMWDGNGDEEDAEFGVEEEEDGEDFDDAEEEGNEGEENQDEDGELGVNQEIVDDLKNKWECENECLKQLRNMYPKGHIMREHGEESTQRAYEAWDAVRPQRPLQQRLYFQKQKLAKAKAKLQKRADALEKLEAELLPKLEEARRLCGAAEEKVQMEQTNWEELLWENDGEQGQGGHKAVDSDSVENAIGKAIETDIGRILARVAESVGDDNPAKQELNLLLQEMEGMVGARKFATGGEGAGPKAGGKHGGSSEDQNSGNGALEAKKKAKTSVHSPEKLKGEPPPRLGGAGDEALADDARRLGEAVEVVANQLNARAVEARSKAEATMVEPLRTRFMELEMQARVGGRDLFKDMVSDGVDVEKVSTAWIAKCVARHGFN